jgi:membrane protease YdiL (CAAX protease family)
MTILRNSLAVGLAAGLIEELGWTGFAVPALRRRYSVDATGFILGLMWSAWHLLPHVWARRAAAGELSDAVYLSLTAVSLLAGYLTAFRILMVRVYDATRSLPLAMLMHISLTASLLALNPEGLAGIDLQAYSFALAAILWVVVAAPVAARRRIA